MRLMLEHKKVSFAHGAILTKEMIEETYAYPRDFLQIKYSNYSDGILFGLNVQQKQESKDIIITKGAVKFRDEIYLLKEDVNLTDYILQQTNINKLEKDGDYYLLLQAEHKQIQECVEDDILSFYIAPNLVGDELCLAYFSRVCDKIDIKYLKNESLEKLQKGKLRALLDIKYANRSDGNEQNIKEATFSPLVFNTIKVFLVNKPKKTMLDYALLVQLQNEQVLSIECMKSYVLMANKSLEDKISRKKLFTSFVEALQETKMESIAKEEVKKESIKTPRKRKGGML